ncbi:hypothetical protein [Methylobacterium sp. P1-11]|uniref:hypothetical protein n=1 Tax=Methylobacterium sp. P1-11 TaxID=2024616 RepID=UPI0011EC1A08|nr:hypothetical protein [Methylobacterium sp. P1-11]
MTDAVIPGNHPRARRDFGKSGPDCRESKADFARLPRRLLWQRDGRASSPFGLHQPARRGFGRQLLDLLVVSFAFGGCIHSIHPDYVDFLQDISSRHHHKN